MSSSAMFGFCKSDPDIPIEQLDYKYVGDCTDTKKLERLLQILRSGEEGSYPDLVRFTEQQLHNIQPDSVLLEKKNKERLTKDLRKTEKENILNEITDFLSKTTQPSNMMNGHDDRLPPVRSSNNINIKTKEGKKVLDEKEKVKKRVAPRSYDEWSKLEKNIDKMEDEAVPPVKTKDKTKINTAPKVHELLEKEDKISKLWASRPLEERNCAAQNEKNKGNEAFNCGDFKEALVYYNRSLAIHKNPSVYNNRAITYIKLEKYEEALKDSNIVIEQEPENIKAYLRRGISYQSLGNLEKALKDFTKVVELEPKNKRGKELYEEVYKEIEKKNSKEKKKGKRIIVEEINSKEAEVINKNTNTKEKQPNDSEIINGNTNTKEKSSNDYKILECNNEETGNEIHKDEKSKDVKSNANSVLKERNGISQTKGRRILITETDSSQNKENKENIDLQDRSGELIETNNIPLGNKLFSPEASESNNTDNKVKDTIFLNTEKKNEIHKDSNKGNGETDKYSESTETDEPKKESVFVKEIPENVLEVQNEGNTQFKTGAYPEALEKYTTAIHMLMDEQPGHDRNLAALFNNCSACHLKIGDCEACIKDTTKSLQFAQTPKAYLRRATAYETKEKYLNAYVDYQAALQLDASILSATQGCTRLASVLKLEHGMNWRDKLPKRINSWTKLNQYQNGVPSNNINTVQQSKTKNTNKLSEKAVQQSAVENANKLSEKEQECGIEKDKLKEIDESKNDRQLEKEENGDTEMSNPTETDTKNNDQFQKVGEENTENIKSKETDANSNSTSKLKPPANKNFVKVEKKKEKAKTKEEIFKETKEKGNGFVQKGEYTQAIKCYSECIRLLPKEVASYTNRALCYLKTNQPAKAQHDCTKALELQGKNVKALFRRAQARKSLKDYKNALADLTQLLKLEPTNTAAKKESEACKELFRVALRQIQNQNLSKKQQQKGKKVKIEEVSGIEKLNPRPSSRISTKAETCPTAKHNPETKAPKLTKMTAYEFLQTLNGIKSNKSQSYAEVLKQIDPDKLPTLISNNLDGDLLKNILKALHDHFTNQSHYLIGVELLQSLTNVSRFKTVFLMLDSSDKKLFRDTINKLEHENQKNNAKSKVVIALQLGELKKIKF